MTLKKKTHIRATQPKVESHVESTDGDSNATEVANFQATWDQAQIFWGDSWHSRSGSQDHCLIGEHFYGH